MWNPVRTWPPAQKHVLNFTAKTLFLAMMGEVLKERPATTMVLLFQAVHSDQDTSSGSVTCSVCFHDHHSHCHNTLPCSFSCLIIRCDTVPSCSGPAADQSACASWQRPRDATPVKHTWLSWACDKYCTNFFPSLHSSMPLCTIHTRCHCVVTVAVQHYGTQPWPTGAVARDCSCSKPTGNTSVRVLKEHRSHAARSQPAAAGDYISGPHSCRCCEHCAALSLTTMHCMLVSTVYWSDVWVLNPLFLTLLISTSNRATEPSANSRVPRVPTKNWSWSLQYFSSYHINGEIWP